MYSLIEPRGIEFACTFVSSEHGSLCERKVQVMLDQQHINIIFVSKYIFVIKIVIFKLLYNYTDNNKLTIYIPWYWNATDTTSCGTVDNTVSEIENSHHL